MICSTSKLHDNGSSMYHRCMDFLTDRDTLKLIKCLDYRRDPAEVTINFGLTRVLGQHGAMAIAALVVEYRYLGKAVTLVGLDPDTEEVCNHILSIQISNSQLLADHLHAALAGLITA